MSGCAGKTGTRPDVYKRQAGGAAAPQRPRGRTAEKAATEVRGDAGRAERGTAEKGLVLDVSIGKIGSLSLIHICTYLPGWTHAAAFSQAGAFREKARARTA